MNSRQKYNLARAVNKLKDSYKDKVIDYEVDDNRKRRCDDALVYLYVNEDIYLITLNTEDLRIINNIYDVLEKFI